MPAGQDKLAFDENNIPHVYRCDVMYIDVTLHMLIFSFGKVIRG